MTQFKYAKYIDAMTPLNSFCVKGLLREIEAGLEVAGEWLGAVGEGGWGGWRRRGPKTDEPSYGPSYRRVLS